MAHRPFQHWPTRALLVITRLHRIVPFTAMQARFELLFRELDEANS